MSRSAQSSRSGRARHALSPVFFCGGGRVEGGPTNPTEVIHADPRQRRGGVGRDAQIRVRRRGHGLDVGEGGPRRAAAPVARAAPPQRDGFESRGARGGGGRRAAGRRGGASLRDARHPGADAGAGPGPRGVQGPRGRRRAGRRARKRKTKKKGTRWRRGTVRRTRRAGRSWPPA